MYYRVYSISDTFAHVARIKSRGARVIHPMGWDAFGLPAENAAIERGVDPAEWTKSNMADMKRQLERLGCSFDWDSEFATCDPTYYKWTQFIFLNLFKTGLAYRKEAVVNWDPVDKTVLADEQVDSEGRSWRSGAKVEQRRLKQWFLRTTEFSKALLDGLDDLEVDGNDWKEVVNVQRGWIGNCDGTRIKFELQGQRFDSPCMFCAYDSPCMFCAYDSPCMFCTYDSPCMFCTYDSHCILYSDDDEIDVWTKTPEIISSSDVFIGVNQEHVLNQKAEAEIEINGIRMRKLNVTAKNPLNGNSIPIYSISNQELFPDGCDSLLGTLTKAENGNSVSALSREEVMKKLDLKFTSSKLKDWLISRQRYWGTPIPIVHCAECGTIPFPLERLPVKLEDDRKCPCPKCGNEAERETDTMDTFVDSSWYFLRFLDSKNENELVEVAKAAEAMPVDLYVGGLEHATLHMYYAR